MRYHWNWKNHRRLTQTTTMRVRAKSWLSLDRLCLGQVLLSRPSKTNSLLEWASQQSVNLLTTMQSTEWWLRSHKVWKETSAAATRWASDLHLVTLNPKAAPETRLENQTNDLERIWDTPNPIKAQSLNRSSILHRQATMSLHLILMNKTRGWRNFCCRLKSWNHHLQQTLRTNR